MQHWILRHEERYHTGYPDDTMVWDAKPTLHMLIQDGGLHPEVAVILHEGGTHTDADGGTYTLTEGSSPVIHIDSDIADHGIWSMFQTIIDQITYKPGWYIRTGVEDRRMWVQIGVTEEAEISFDPIAKTKTPWRGAKHYLSMHMCRNEIVSIVFHAIERAEMHEVKEWFRYKKRSIFNPHLDPDALAELASKKTSFNVRRNAMTMEEEEVK